jgi:predicted nucleic acid-binding protein
MANLIVDSSVAIKWFVPEPYSTEARRILDDYQTGAVSFLAPDLINAEFGNIVWKKRLFQGLDEADAQTVIDEFRKVTFRLTSTAELLEEAFLLAVTHHRSVYDMLYLALSIRENCQFVTADEKMVNAIGSSFPNVVWVAKRP